MTLSDKNVSDSGSETLFNGENLSILMNETENVNVGVEDGGGVGSWDNVSTEVYLDKLNAEFADIVLPAIVLLLILMVIGVLGNGLVLYVYTWRANGGGTVTRFIQALAVFDLLSCCVAIPGEIFDMQHNYTFGATCWCPVVRTVNYFCALASGATLMVVAIDRYKRICSPLKRQITPQGAVVIILMCTGISSVVALPSSVLYGSQSTPTDIATINGTDCSIKDRFEDTAIPIAYNLLQLVIFSTGAIILVTIYTLVGRTIFRHVRERKRRQRRHKGVKMATPSLPSDPSDPSPPVSPLSPPTSASVLLSDKDKMAFPFRFPVLFQNNKQNDTDDDCDSEPNFSQNDDVTNKKESDVDVRRKHKASPLVEISKPEHHVTRTKSPQDQQRSLFDLKIEIGSETDQRQSLEKQVNVIHLTSSNQLNSETSQKSKQQKSLTSDTHETMMSHDGFHLEITPSEGTATPWDNYSTGSGSPSSQGQTTSTDQESVDTDLGQCSPSHCTSHSTSHCPTTPTSSIPLKCPNIFTVTQKERRSISSSSEELSHSQLTKSISSADQVHGTYPTTKVLMRQKRAMTFDENARNFVKRRDTQNLCNGVLRHSVAIGCQDDQWTEQGEGQSKKKVVLFTSASFGKTDKERKGWKERRTTNTGSTTEAASRLRRRSSIRNFIDSKLSLRSDSLGTRRTTLMLSLITVVYVFSFLPHLALMALKANDVTSSRDSILIRNLLIRSYFLNSVANPIIYSFCSKTFFSDCKKALTCQRV